MTMKDWETAIDEVLEPLAQKHLLRQLTQVRGLDFYSNDYLALSKDKSALQAGLEAAKTFGTGSTGSRLLSGNPSIFEAFEQQIAQDKHSESALIFNSGYVANASAIEAFLDLNFQLFFDKLNHASLYPLWDSHHVHPALHRYPHLNLEVLEALLAKHKTYPRKLIVSETVFGMDGDRAPVEKLAQLAEQYQALLYLDEAHATGLYGPQGYGISTEIPLDPKKTFIMGTFSKALASSGAYIACPKCFKDYLIQKGKAFIYSTALSPFCMGVAQHNWQQLPSLKAQRRHVLKLTANLRHQLSQQGWAYVGQDTHIIAILFDTVEDMLSMHQKLLDHQILTSAIRPPTSPSPRLRLAINARHTQADVDFFIKTLMECK